MEQLNPEKFDNFISVAVALKITVDGLQDFVQDSLKTVHQQLYRKCSILQCNVNCSRRYGTRFAQWCNACKLWKNELRKLNKFKNHWDRINWKEINTIDLPLSYEEMTKVFVQNFASVRQGGLLQDMGAIMSLFINLKTFDGIVNQSIISDIQRFRNQNFGHNYSLQLYDVEKTQSIDCFENLLRVAEITCTKSATKSLLLLGKVRRNKKVPSELLDQTTLNIVAVIKTDFNRLNELHREDSVYETLHKQIEVNLQMLTKPTGQIMTHKRNYLNLMCVALLILVAAYCFLQILFEVYSHKRKNNSDDGCISMNFDAYWKSDLDFDYYVKDLKNQSTVERLWLQKEVQKGTEIRNRGLLLIAGMGYGKSSIISNIVCANKNSPWHQQRQQVLAYHMCRYDIKMSTKSGVFIRNLAGRMVTTIPQIGNMILSDDRALEFLYGTKCIEDPISCLEFSILNPLQSFSTDQTYLIVIDALDECDIKGDNTLVNLFYKKISFFPKYIKFIFTSRNIEHLVYKFKELYRVDLESFIPKNTADIMEYIDKTIQLSHTDIVKLIEVSERNFLHVKLYLQHCEHQRIGNCERIPESLDKLYTLNFERVFGENTEIFEEFVHIFEVLCSLQSPVEEHKLLEIARIFDEERKRKALRTLRNELGHFVKNSNGLLSFQHKSLSDFLTDPSRKYLHFYVNRANGHKRFADYLLKSLNLTQSDNLIEIVYHVALSDEVECQQLLLDFSNEFGRDRIESNFTYLYEAARQINHLNTIKLLIKLVIPSVNSATSVERNISVAAFIAVGNGNDESLKAFLQRGANIRFKNLPILDKVFLPTNFVSECKYTLLCGYTFLHVAAQRGYTKIVKYLLSLDETLLYDTNSLNLNAFQLAAEHGHTDVMNIILKYNRSIADLHSLHHASENGHTKAVEILLKYVEDKCLPCNGSLHWRLVIPTHIRDEIGKSSITIIVQDFWKYLLPFQGNNFSRDDFWLVKCDTALNAAVRNGYLGIVKAILNKSTDTLNCRSFDGSSALMTAVKYNQTDIFKYLYEMKADHLLQCEGIYTYDSSKIFISEQKFLYANQCPRKLCIEHLLAIYDNSELAHFMVNKGHRFWEPQDGKGLTPLHYAFCHSSYRFIGFFTTHASISLNFTFTSQNGSTPFHSAASCKSFMLHRYLNENHGIFRSYSIPNVLDNQGSSILHYGMNSSVSADDLIKIDQSGKDEFTFSLFKVVLLSGHDMHQIDSNKRNFLHYAAQSGNYWAFLLSISIDKINVTMLLNQRDINKRTPLEVAFDVLPKRDSFEHVRIPHNCLFNEVFTTACNTNYSLLLSPHEYFIFRVSQYFNSNHLFTGYNISELLIISINKSRIYPVLILKTYDNENFISTMINSTVLQYYISKSDIPFLSELILHVDNSLRCDGSESPLHIILQNDRNIRWEFSSFSFLEPLFKMHSINYLDKCFDKEGYNLLQRSVMGGNWQLFLYLINKGFNIWQTSRNNMSLLEICIMNAPYLKNGSIPLYYANGSRFHILQYIFQDMDVLYHHGYHKSYDETLKKIVSKMEKSKSFNKPDLKTKLCKTKKKELGLIHIAAAKGMLLFLKKIKTIYGVNILKCEDYYHITPIYLAHIYNQSNVVRWMNTKNIYVRGPNKVAQKILLYNFIENYPSKSKFDWVCFIRYRYKYLTLIGRQLSRCSCGNQHFQILFSYNSTREKEIKQRYFRNLYNMHKVHSKHSIVQVAYMCAQKIRQDAGYRMLRLYMLFGYDDKAFYYQFLLQLLKITEQNIELYTYELDGIFLTVNSRKFHHLGKLKMRSDLHSLWLKDLLPSDAVIYLKFLSFKSLQYKWITEVIFGNHKRKLRSCKRNFKTLKELPLNDVLVLY